MSVIRFIEIVLLEHLKQRRGPMLAILLIGPLIALILGYFGGFAAGRLSSQDWISIAWHTWALMICPLFMSLCFGSIAAVENEDKRWDFVHLGIDSSELWYLAKFVLGLIYFLCCNLLLTASSIVVLLVVGASKIGLVEVLLHGAWFSVTGLWLISTLWVASFMLRSLALHGVALAATLGFVFARMTDAIQISPWGVLPLLKSDTYLADARLALFASCFTLGAALLLFGKFAPGRAHK
jgi:hypothetical protein